MAYQGIDSRDLYRRGSGMTLRRLGVLINALPPGCPLHLSVLEAQEKAKKPAADLIRQRQAEFERRNAAQRAKGA